MRAKYLFILVAFAGALFFVSRAVKTGLFTWTIGHGGGAAETIAQGSGEFHWVGELASGQVIEIKGVNGSILAVGSDDSSVRVDARMKSRRGRRSNVRVEVVKRDDGYTVCAVYGGSRSSGCRPGRGGLKARNSDTQVNFEVAVPAGVKLIASTVNGSIRSDGVSGLVSATTVNGSLELQGAEAVEGQTVNGAIRVALRSAESTAPVDLSSVNGKITLTLPAGMNADVDAAVTNGSLLTQFPLKVQGRFNRRFLKGTLGQGGRRIELRSVNGSIAIDKSSQR